MKWKRQIIRSVAFAGSTLALCCFLCWMGGYNFDHRGEDVGCASAMVALATLMAGFVGYAIEDLLN